MIYLPDPAEEAKRLSNDPDYLRRKADYIEAQIVRGGPLEASRRYRVKELRAQADDLQAPADPFAGIVDVPTNDGWDT